LEGVNREHQEFVSQAKIEEALFHYKNPALFDKILSNSVGDDSEDSN
jgi:hypothetical protein